jgi:hypothetical protein
MDVDVEIGFWFLDLRCDGDVDWEFTWRRRMVEYGDERDDGGGNNSVKV